MAKTKISEFSSTPGNNTDIDGINIAEGCAPSGINNAIRELMSQLKDWQAGTSNDPMVIGSTGSLTLSYGTANGVAYLNGSKVLTTGSALTFDGTYFNANGLRISGSDAGNTIYKASGNFFLTADAGTLALQANTSNPIAFYLNSSEQMRLTSTGLGIGTSSPLGKVHSSSGSSGATPSANGNQLVAESSGNAGLTIATGASSLGNIFFADSGDNADGFIQYDQSGRSLRFGTATSEKMRLDSSGNLGLGVTPSAWQSGLTSLDLKSEGFISGGGSYIALLSNTYFNSGARYKTTGFNATQYLQQSGAHIWSTASPGTAGNAISFTQAMTLDASGLLALGTTSPASATRLTLDYPGFVQMVMRSSGTDRISLYGDASVSAVDAKANPLAFYAGSAERARIDSSGNLLVGTTSIIARVSGVANSGVIAYFTNSSGTGVAMYPGNTGWSSVSDERAKIINSPISDAVSKVSSLRAVLGRYKTDDEEKSRAFLIAQDVQAVLPEAVTEQPDGMLALQMTDTIPLLVAAIQEQQTQISDQLAIINQLKARLDAANL